MKTWVIGGLSGIGEAVCEHMRKEYAGRSPWSLKVTGEDVSVTNINVLNNFVGRNNPFDEIVYCAGIQQLGFLGDDIHDDVSDIFGVNVMGFINVLDVVAQHQTGPLSVVAIVSDASRVPMRGSIAYCASKAALHQAVRVAAREMAPRWRVNGVSPGIVEDTPMTAGIDKAVQLMRNWTAEEAAAYEQSLIPMKRRARKDEVARVIVDVLRGPEYMTGSIVEITGGK